MIKSKNKKIAALLLSAMLAFTVVSGVLSLPKAKAAAPEEGYIPQYAEVYADTFEGLTPAAANQATQYIWDYTNLFYVEGNAANVTTASGEVIAGVASLKWLPGHTTADGWSTSATTLGLAIQKVTGISGGYMLRLDMKIRFGGIDTLVIKNIVKGASESTLQECVVSGDYTRDEHPDYKDKDPETAITVTAKDGYAEVSFALRGDVSNPMYYAFSAKTQTAESFIIFDDVKIFKEQKPELEYRAYENFIVENFEGESKFKVQDGASASVVTDDVIAGEKSLKVSLATRNAKVLALKTDVITGLTNGYFKLYYRFKASLVSEIYVYIKNAADDSVIYDNCYNVNAKSRIIEKCSPLFDSSAFDYNAKGVYKSYGEFNVPEGVSAYAEIHFKVERTNGYLILDDFNILREYEPQSILATRQPDNSAVKYTETLNAKAGSVKKTGNGGAAASIGADGAAMIVVGVYAFAVAALVAAIAFRKKAKHANKLMMLLICAVVALPAAALGACGNKRSDEPEVPAGYNVVSPEKITGKLDNPGMGWVVLEEPTYGGHVDLGGSGTLPEVDNVSLDTSWAHIEVEEDVYDFNYLDQAIEYYTSIGKRVNFRICTDTLMLTYTYKGVPDYLFEKYNVAYEERDYSDPGPKRTFIVPDLTDKNYVDRLGKFLEVLAARYADNDMIDTVEIRGYGVWGEWHSGYQYEDKNERMAALQNIIDKYYDVYAATGKVLAVPAAWDPVYTSTGGYELEGDSAYMNYVNWSAFDYQWRLPNSTFRRDSGGGLMFYRYDEKILAEAFRSGKRVPLLGEYGTGYAALSTMQNGYDLIDGINDILYKMRANYSTVLGWVGLEIANLIAKGETEFIDRGNEMFGYRLTTDRVAYPAKVSAGKEVTVLTEWSNSAVGRFIYDSPLAIYLLDSEGNTVYKYTDEEFDARTFVQGETTDIYTSFTLPETVQAGDYRLAIAITGDDGEPYIELGQAGKVGDSRMYEIGSITVDSNVKTSAFFTKTDYANVNSYAFKGNTAYRVTFKYLPGFDMANFYFGENTGYEFAMTTAKGGAENTVGSYKWQDISGEAGWKTVSFVTGDYNDYKMGVISDKFGEITIGDVYIEEVKGTVTEGFEDYDFTDSTTILEPINQKTARLYTGGDNNSYANSVSPLYGATSVRLAERNNRGYNVLAKVDVNNYKFVKGRLYRVTFDFMNVDEVAKGGYFLLGTGKYSEVTKESSPIDVVAEWYERDDTFITKKSFTFLCEDDETTLVFGVKNGGTYLIDNLVITAVELSGTVEGEDLVNKRNVIPTYDFGIGVKETFEGGSFARSGFDWAQFAWGRMTIDENEVVGYGDDNKCSLLGRVEVEVQNPATDTVWFEFAKTKREYYKFEAGATYNIEFDYKILKLYPQGKIFCFFRDDTASNRFGTVAGEVDLSTGKKVGEVIHFSTTVTLGNYNNYQFFVSMNYAWEVSVDNILITKA